MGADSGLVLYLRGFQRIGPRSIALRLHPQYLDLSTFAKVALSEYD